MTEGKQDRDPMATGTTVIASSDVVDADNVQVRGDQAGPARPEPERDRAAADDSPPPGFRKALGKVAREHRGAAFASAILLLLLLVAAVGGTGLAIWALGKEGQAEKAEKEAIEKSQKAEEAEELYKGKFHAKEAEWRTVLQELHRVQASEATARRSADETKAILDFFKRKLLSAGAPGNVSLEDAFWTGGQGKDVTLHKAVDVAEAQVDETFPDRPLAEASVREMLGLAYLSVGDPARAVKQYERTLELRQAMQGFDHPDTAACRNQLAVAYRLAGRANEASLLFDRNPYSPDHASALAVRGLMLLQEKKPAEAALKLRECLRIRQKIQPDDWTTAETESLLGEALLEQKKFAEAEPMLLRGYEGMQLHADSIPPQDKPRLIKALERLVKLYEAWGNTEKATRWRKELELAQAKGKS
jgi:tetratricopeptide (TPR) repeat protein